MTVRVAYSLCGPTPGAEFAELKDLTQMLPMGFGDDMLRFNGLGERITWAMNNNNKPSDARQAEVLRDRPMGRGARDVDHDALAERGIGGSVADDFRARESGSADHRAALVDRAFEQCVAGESAPHESPGDGMDGAGPPRGGNRQS